jgi:hypothetical protein
MLSVDGSIWMESWFSQQKRTECRMNKKHVQWARLVQETLLLLTMLIKLVEAVVELLNKAVNCRHAAQF